MKKPRIALKDPHYLSLDDPRFDNAKLAIGKPCRTSIGIAADGREFMDVEGHIVGVDSRPFKGGRDGVYVAIKTEKSEFYVYAEFRFVEIIGKVGEPVSPGPVLTPQPKFNGKMLNT